MLQNTALSPFAPWPVTKCKRGPGDEQFSTPVPCLLWASNRATSTNNTSDSGQKNKTLSLFHPRQRNVRRRVWLFSGVCRYLKSFFFFFDVVRDLWMRISEALRPSSRRLPGGGARPQTFQSILPPPEKETTEMTVFLFVVSLFSRGEEPSPNRRKINK